MCYTFVEQMAAGAVSHLGNCGYERTKEKYVSNPDVNTSRSKYNFHLVKPPASTGLSQSDKLLPPDAVPGKIVSV